MGVIIDIDSGSRVSIMRNMRKHGSSNADEYGYQKARYTRLLWDSNTGLAVSMSYDRWRNVPSERSEAVADLQSGTHRTGLRHVLGHCTVG